MTTTVSFGQGGNASTILLEPDMLDAHVQPTGTSPGMVGEQIADTAYNGLVGVSYSDGFDFDVLGKWNSVKDVQLVSDHAVNMSFDSFVHADAFVTGTGNTTLEFENIKRLNVETDRGNDTVNATLSTNNSTWENQVNISTGGGNDTITIGQGQVLAGTNGAGTAKVTDGHFTTITIDAGDGNDTIDLSGITAKHSDITGGRGNDTMFASHGEDVFHFAAGSGNDMILGFQVGQDKLDLGGMHVAQHMELGGNLLLAFDDAQHSTLMLAGVSFSDNLFV